MNICTMLCMSHHIRCDVPEMPQKRWRRHTKRNCMMHIFSLSLDAQSLSLFLDAYDNVHMCAAALPLEFACCESV